MKKLSNKTEWTIIIVGLILTALNIGLHFASRQPDAAENEALAFMMKWFGSFAAWAFIFGTVPVILLVKNAIIFVSTRSQNATMPTVNGEKSELTRAQVNALTAFLNKTPVEREACPICGKQIAPLEVGRERGYGKLYQLLEYKCNVGVYVWMCPDCGIAKRGLQKVPASVKYVATCYLDSDKDKPTEGGFYPSENGETHFVLTRADLGTHFFIANPKIRDIQALQELVRGKKFDPTIVE